MDWVWNKTEQRRDPRTGRRRCFPKPASEWVIQEDESLRMVPQDLWEQVRTRRKEVRRSWPGVKMADSFPSPALPHLDWLVAIFLPIFAEKIAHSRS